MNIIVLGKIHEGAFHVVERQDSNTDWWPVKYGDWAGDWEVDWYYYDGEATDFGKHPFSDPGNFKLTDYPLVPVNYEGQYVLGVLVNDYEPENNERLVKVGPVSPAVIKQTLQDMWS